MKKAPEIHPINGTMSFANVRTIAATLDATAMRFPSRRALVSPHQLSPEHKTSFTYQELRRTSNALAGFLNLYGYERHDLMVSDLPNTTENLMLQLACNRLGVHYATAKNLEAMASQFTKVRGAVAATASGFLAETNLPLPYLDGSFLIDLIHNDGLRGFALEDHDQEDADGAEHMAHAFYNSKSGYTNQQALRHGQEAADQLEMTEKDVVCISITLCHPFGMGTAVCSALQRGSCIALPAVGGIQDCGVPSERAAATFELLESEKCTLIFADTHTLKALPPALVPDKDDPTKENQYLPHLRGGICKVGSGSDFLYETVAYGGIKLKTMSKHK